ncbi:MAG: DegT/DnrJ/EryC1/StrS family aminotransferase [Parcubacteria group bacterium]
MQTIPLSSPDITDFEKQKVMDVLNTPNLSMGPVLPEFEKAFAAYVGTKYAVAVNSGTSGLHLCVKALDIKDNDYVFTTPFSFIASANCLLFERAIPIFVDIDEKTFNIDVNKLEAAIIKAKNEDKSIKAILPVHVFGRPCDMDAIKNLADEFKLSIIEDACEAVGAEYSTKENGWKKTGAFGDCAVFAFYPNKQMTTGEGGMIVTDDENIYKLCRSMRNQGRGEDHSTGSGHDSWLQHERLGYNYRLSNINCALGLAQLQRIEEMLDKRTKVAESYNEKLKEINEIILPQKEDNKKISWFVYVIRLTDSYSQKDRDFVLDELRKEGIGCSNYFTPIHLQPFYQNAFGYKYGDFPITERISERTIALPFFNNLSEAQIDVVAEALQNALNKIQK